MLMLVAPLKKAEHLKGQAYQERHISVDNLSSTPYGPFCCECMSVDQSAIGTPCSIVRDPVLLPPSSFTSADFNE